MTPQPDLIRNRKLLSRFASLLLAGTTLFFSNLAQADTPTVQTFTTGGAGSWSCPSGVNLVQVEVWGGGGAGGGGYKGSGTSKNGYGGGGGGGAYARTNACSVSAGNYSYSVGAGGTGTTPNGSGGNGGIGADSSFVSSGTLDATGGNGGTGGNGAVAVGYGTGGSAGATGATGDAQSAGGAGATPSGNSAAGGGGGGGGYAGAGTAGSGATAGAGGGGGGLNGSGSAGGAGGIGVSVSATGSIGTIPGGGGGGAKSGAVSTGFAGGNGASGQVKFTYYVTPTTQASGVGFSSVGSANMVISWTPGNVGSSLVLVKAGSAVNAAPVNGTIYTPNSVVGSGTQLGTGNYAVYQGTGSTVTISGLSVGTTYYVAVYAANGVGTVLAEYLTSSPATGNQATVSVPSLTSPSKSGLGLNSVTLGATLSLTNGSTISEYGIVWNTTGNPTTSDHKIIAGTSVTTQPITFTVGVTGLPVGSTIYYAGYATSSAGTGYSLSDSFTYSPQLYWATTSGTWNVNTSGNLVWQDAVASTTYYQDGDQVVFNDTGNGTVTLNSTVNPATLLVSNNLSAYTITGSGTIAGAIPLTKLGTNTLTLATANTYTGGTTNSAGTLALGNAAAMGTGTLTMNGGNLDSSVANLVNANNNAQNWNADFTFAGSQNLDLGTGNVALGASRQVTVSANTLTVGGIISGAGFGLTKTGNGTLALTSTNTYTGGTTVSGGVLALPSANGPGGIGSIIGSLTVSSGAEAQSGNSWSLGFGKNYVTNIVLNGGTLTFTGGSSFPSDTGFAGTNLTMTGATVQANNGGSGFDFYAGSGANQTTYVNVLASSVTSVISCQTDLRLGTGSLVFNVAGGGSGNDLLISGAIVPATTSTVGGSISKTGNGILTLSAVNTFSGNITINTGTLALSGSGSIANTTNIIVANGTVLDVSGLSSAFTLGSSQTLSNSAVGAILNGANNTGSGTVSLVYDGVNPSFIITNGGMTLSASTVFKVNKTGAALLPGNYKIISKAATGNVGLVAGTVPSVTLTGGQPVSGTPSLTIVNGELYLTVGGISAWSYTGTSFTYDGTAKSPTISFVGSTSTPKTTNYVGTSVSYNSVNAPTNVGTYYVSNTVAADANYFGTTNVQAFTISPKAASVTAIAQTKIYGAVNPVLTAVTNGAVNGDVINVTLATDATQFSAVGVSNITVTAGSNPNYTVLTTNSTLTITSASTSVGASSTNNPSGYHDAVAFLATLPSDATGSVVFSSTNGSFSTNTVTGASTTSLSITNLPRGTNVITVAYLGGGNYVGSTNSLNQVVTNHPPVANVMTVTRTAGLALTIKLSDIATNWSDADNDPVALTGVSMQSTNGINLFALNWSTNLDGSIITTNAYAYIGYTNSPNVNDQISYSIADGFGGTNLGYVAIVIQSSVTGTNSITAHDFTSSPYSNTITAYGIPNYYYVLERATNLTSPVWVNVQTNQANATNGVINAADTFWDLGGVKPSPSAFYQLKWQP